MARRRIDLHRALVRFLFATLGGAVVAAGTSRYGPVLATLAGWNAASIILLILSWLPVMQADAAATQRRAGSEDPGRTVVYALVLVVSAASLFAAVSVARHAHDVAPGRTGVLVGLCLSTVALAWALTHTAFTLRYARLYYREDHEGVGGVDFPGGQRPSYFDFAYFAFTIGMTFQVSDTTISSHQIRRAVLLHAVIAFVYNTAILAFALNLAFGAMG